MLVYGCRCTDVGVRMLAYGIDVRMFDLSWCTDARQVPRPTRAEGSGALPEPAHINEIHLTI